jgi:hypothetical protein
MNVMSDEYPGSLLVTLCNTTQLGFSSLALYLAFSGLDKA